MNVEIGTEAAPEFPEKEYANGIFVAVYPTLSLLLSHSKKNSRYLQRAAFASRKGTGGAK